MPTDADPEAVGDDGREPPGWVVEQVSGTARALHELDVPPSTRLVRLNEVTDDCLVLGSTQAEATLVTDELAARSMTWARRRSGGGAVWLAPGRQVWVDVVVPAGDPLWVDDVSRSSWWLGRCWAAAMEQLGAAPTAVHTTRLTDRVLGRLACFAALGPGEVTSGGKKLVGISQRRTRHSARFQCVVYLDWDPEPLLAALDLGDHRSALERVLREDVTDLSQLVGPAGPTRTDGNASWRVVEELVRLLP